MSSASIFRRGILLCIPLLASTQLNAAEKAPNGLPNLSTPTGNWNISADFLAWYTSEEVGSIWADVISLGNNASTWKAPSFKFPWDYGFRIGLGHNLKYDQWDTALSWTWFRTEAKHSIPFTPYTHIGPEFFAGFLSGNVPQSMNATWSLLLNMFDWELGRNYWVSKGLSLRPFLGLKGGWIDQSIHAHYRDLTIDNVPTQNSGKEHVKNNFWGIGPLGGINTQWKVRSFKSHYLSFFGDFSTAALWGTWINSDVYKNTAAQKSSVNMKNSTLGALMFRGFLGIGWDVDIRAGKSHFSTKLGYEMQLWLDQLRLATFQLQRIHNDLTLQGVTFNCQFDF